MEYAELVTLILTFTLSSGLFEDHRPSNRFCGKNSFILFQTWLSKEKNNSIDPRKLKKVFDEMNDNSECPILYGPYLVWIRQIKCLHAFFVKKGLDKLIQGHSRSKIEKKVRIWLIKSNPPA